MIEVFNKFSSNINYLKNHIEFINSFDHLARFEPHKLDANLVEKVKTNRIKKVLDYSSIIISLYGYLERFVEDLIEDYLNKLSRIIINYNSLPEKIINNHFEFSAKLLQNINLPKYSILTTKEDIIKNLNSCIENSNYKLNTLAFIAHDLNLRHQKIAEISKEVGVQPNLIKSEPVFKDFLKQKSGIDHPELMNDEILFNLLIDLAQRRNEIAHGVKVIQLIEPSMLLDYIEFVYTYCLSLYKVFLNELNRYKVLYTAEKIEEKIKVIDGHILCAGVKNKTLNVGDSLLIKTCENKFISRKVEEIQINKKSFSTINVKRKRNVGIKLEKGFPKLKLSYEYFFEK